MSTYWGEIPNLQDTDSGIAALEREQMTKARPMVVEGPPLHQPTSCQPSQNHPAEAFSVDSLTTHTIKLIQYARKVRTMIQSVQQHREGQKATEGEDVKLPIFADPPPLPEYTGPQMKHKPLDPLPYMPRDMDSPFFTGLGVAPPEIDSKSCRKLLQRSVAVICSHAGYDNCGELILETMTDVCQEYIRQMTGLLRRAVDDQLMHGSDGFSDAMERVFHEMGIGSPTVLHEFYQTRIINYHRNMQKTCERLLKEYNLVCKPDVKVNVDIKPLIKVKEETLSDIQFPALDVDESGENDQVIHLEGLGLDINIVNEPSNPLTTEEDTSKWTNKTEQDKSGLDGYDQENTSVQQIPVTPSMDSEGGESLQDPGSVSDIMSPPSIGIRPKQPPHKKRKK